MTALALIEAARSAGLTLAADGPDLVIRPAARLQPELRQQLAAHKPEVMDALRAKDLPALPLPEPCAQCRSTSWVVSLIVDGSERVCSNCALGRTQLRGGCGP